MDMDNYSDKYGGLTMRVGRKRTKQMEKMLDAMNYCIEYCDGQDDCTECMFKNVRIDNSTECPIYVITTLKDAVEAKIDDDEDDIEWEEIEI